MLLGVGVALIGFVLVLARTDALRQYELDSIDTRFAIRGPSGPPSDIVDVYIDDVTLNDLQRQFPFPRRLHAAVIDRLRRAGARVIVYDIQFTEPTEPRDDNALIAATTRAGHRMVLSTSEVNGSGESAIFGSQQDVDATGAQVGTALLPLDRDGVTRRLEYAVDGLPTLAVVAAEEARRSPVADGRSRRTAWIDFHGPPGAVPGVSFSRVYRGQIDSDRFKDKIVVVGVSAATSHDLHPTSVSRDRPMSGAEVQANAISTLLRGAPLHEAPKWLGGGLAALFGIMAPLASLLLPRPRGLLVAIAAIPLYAVVVQLAFGTGLILPFVYPALALVLAAVGVLAVEYTASAFERERVRDLFARFVPESVVDEVIDATDDDLCLGGRRVQSTVLFCDIREFTTFAELRPAEQVIDVLNRYLKEMSEAIRAAGGTLLAYQGDGILAVFGAPIEQFDHADRAVAAVRDMMKVRLAQFNTWLREQGLGLGFRIGIGLNSGVIMSGNVGCEWRLEYTAIGDTVNTASRLEKMTKDSPHQVLISDTTRAMLRDDTKDLIYIDAMTVRGKAVKVNLWTLDINGASAPDDGARATASPA